MAPQSKKTPKRSAAKTPAMLAVQDLRKATLSSVRAVVGRGFPGKPGIIVGFWLEDASLEKLGREPGDIAADVSKSVSRASGIRVKPGFVRGAGGILVGYMQPTVRLNR